MIKMQREMFYFIETPITLHHKEIPKGCTKCLEHKWFSFIMHWEECNKDANAFGGGCSCKCYVKELKQWVNVAKKCGIVSEPIKTKPNYRGHCRVAL
jgi:hypothetical protein